MRTYKITIGSNNTTGKLESKKAIAVVAYEFDGFGYYEQTGYWKGKPEPSAVFTIVTDNAELIGVVAARLKQVLEQEAVMVSCIGESYFI